MYKIKVGISACLLGQEVRFDGGHKRSSFCERDLGAHFEYHPVCPEMAIGLGAPRAAIRLVKRHGEVRAEARESRYAGGRSGRRMRSRLSEREIP